MNLLGIDRGERVVEGLDDVVSIPRAGNNGTQSCGEEKKNVTKTESSENNHKNRKQ